MQRDYDSIIQFENENSGIDFKAIQYEKKKHDALLKDIIAMANADIEGERLIIIGVKHKPDGSRNILPIDKNSFVDSAIYQQLVRENIEPDLSIEYVPHEYGGQLLGLLKINNCIDRPYMLKKDFQKLNKGDCFIRKGTHQFRASRKDLDRIFNNKKEVTDFSKNLIIGFSNTDYSQSILLHPIENIKLPSQRAAERIKNIIAQKKEELANLDPATQLAMQFNVNNLFSNSIFGDAPYEERSISTLKKDLESVEKTYKKDDIYEILEKKSFHLNFDIYNNSGEYIHDASTIVEIANDKSYIIPESLPRKPQHNHLIPEFHNFDQSWMDYPNVCVNENKYIINSTIGEIKHNLKTQLFKEDLRLVLKGIPELKVIEIKIQIFGKNLVTPITKVLKIECKENLTEQNA